MIIEFALIQNFLISTLVVTFLLAFGITIKNALKRKINPDNKVSDVTGHDLPAHDSEPIIQSETTSEQDINKTSYQNVMTHAQHHARKLIHDTSIEAGNILTGAKRTNEHMEEQLDKVLQNIAAKDIRTLKSTTEHYDLSYQQNLELIQKQMHDASSTMMENTEKKYNEKLEEFTQELLKKGLTTQDVIDKRTAELLKLTESEIEEYKKNKLATIDDQINKLLQKTYRDVLRTGMPENTHQDLIMKSLETAKKDGLFKL